MGTCAVDGAGEPCCQALRACGPKNGCVMNGCVPELPEVPEPWVCGAMNIRNSPSVSVFGKTALLPEALASP